MKGFKPSGYGPTSGFSFPKSFGFTGSTGSVTNVSPYVRRKAFANGGMVKSEPGDQGSALVRRSKPTTELDAESGGRSPLRPGFKMGGKPTKRVKKAQGGPLIRGALAQAARAKVQRPKEAIGAIKSKFYEDGGPVVRGSSSKGFLSDLKKLPEGFKEAAKYLMQREGATSSGMAKKGADRISGRQKQIDDYVTRAERGYARGGKVHDDAAQDRPMMERIATKTAKRMCKADGGEVLKAARKA